MRRGVSLRRMLNGKWKSLIRNILRVNIYNLDIVMMI